jgi:hypothetical protein
MHRALIVDGGSRRTCYASEEPYPPLTRSKAIIKLGSGTLQVILISIVVVVQRGSFALSFSSIPRSRDGSAYYTTAGCAVE